MADQEREDGPSLELPSFGFGRKRRQQPDEPADEPTDEARTMPAVPATPAPSPTQKSAQKPAKKEPARRQPPAPAPAAVPAAAPLPGPVETREPEPAVSRRGLPALPGRTAALITGLLVGVVIVGLTRGAFQLCQVLQGTSSCGNPGYLLLVAILVATVLLGAMLLRAWEVPDATSTSLLAVGLLAVFALVFLVDALFSWSMIIVIPVVCAATYALSHAVTASITEDDAS